MQRFKFSPFAVSASLLFLGCLEIVALLFAFEQPAHAYVDPGSGFVFLQVAGSMMAGAVFYLRHRVKKLLGFARKTDHVSQSAVNSGETETAP